MNLRLALILALLLVVAPGWARSEVTYSPAWITPPAVAREFRGAWVATVNNIDWPSKPGLSVAQQKAELLAIIERAQSLRLNALIFQVRPSCDAFYQSNMEPWSPYLSGRMGLAPGPAFDPLAFVVAEAHRHGLELHAWFNPFRARFNAIPGSVSADHVSQRRPDLVRKYGRYLWLDPGEKAAREYSLGVILDVVKRYDVDGIHLDDYFYPYPERNARDEVIEFPDESSWRRYVAAGGKLSREDWRRDNINDFVQRLYQQVKARKPWVKVGLSPFGIWRPNHPAGIHGLDQYRELFADPRKWLTNGWCDYLSPQLYWGIEPREQSYPLLLQWWTEQNPRGRHLWPGNNTANVSSGKWRASEILNQIRRTRQQPGVTGNVHWNMSALMRNSSGIGTALRDTLYREPALVPASPWLDARPPGRPTLRAMASGTGVTATWSAAPGETPSLWVLQWKTAGTWQTRIRPGSESSLSLPGVAPQAIAVSAVDRCGNASPPAVLARGP